MSAQIYVNSARDGFPFDGWTEVQGGGTTDASLGAAAFGQRLYVFGKGMDGKVYSNSAKENQPFGSWTEVQGGGTTDTALAAAAFRQRLYVFGKGVRVTASPGPEGPQLAQPQITVQQLAPASGGEAKFRVSGRGFRRGVDLLIHYESRLRDAKRVHTTDGSGNLPGGPGDTDSIRGMNGISIRITAEDHIAPHGRIRSNTVVHTCL